MSERLADDDVLARLRDAERITELEAEVERLNDALDAADVRYQMLGEWGERMKAEVKHLRAYAEKEEAEETP